MQLKNRRAKSLECGYKRDKFISTAYLLLTLNKNDLGIYALSHCIIWWAVCDSNTRPTD